jgi:hypothetical protein
MIQDVQSHEIKIYITKFIRQLVGVLNGGELDLLNAWKKQGSHTEFWF